VVSRLLLWLIRLYQLFLSPFLGGQCRFYPSCSRYAYACIEGHGAARGALLSVVRLCKCHPFHPGGHDPPPVVERAVVERAVLERAVLERAVERPAGASVERAGGTGPAAEVAEASATRAAQVEGFGVGQGPPPLG
jgi:uncharacterized protein